MVFLLCISYLRLHSLKVTRSMKSSVKIYSNSDILTINKLKNLFGKYIASRDFKKRLLPLLLNQQITMIKINETVEIPFYKIQSVGRNFPLIRPIVKFGTVGRISNYSAKLEKLEVGFNRLCKMLRHPEVLQEIERHNFSIIASVSNEKRSIQGEKMIERFGMMYFSGGFEIYIRHLRTGRI